MKANAALKMQGSTTQAQRPGSRDATVATATLTPVSLQRMVGCGRRLFQRSSNRSTGILRKSSIVN